MPDPTAPPHRATTLRTARGDVRVALERAIVGILFAAACVAVVATGAIFWTMATNGFDFFRQVPPGEFLFGSTWTPDFVPRHFGIRPLLTGTLKIALGAAAVGVPLGVGAAIYISEFAPARVRRFVKPAIEILAGIPSIVFGLMAVFFIGPWIQDTFGLPDIYSALAASLALGVMVIPIICAISEDAIRAVPRELREGSLALGSTTWETAWRVTIPAARSGITAATILGFSRAIGETMVVLMIAGLIPSNSWDYLGKSQTITGYIANRAMGDLPSGSLQYLSIFAVGLVLFLVTFGINLVAEFILARHRRRYA